MIGAFSVRIMPSSRIALGIMLALGSPAAAQILPIDPNARQTSDETERPDEGARVISDAEPGGIVQARRSAADSKPLARVDSRIDNRIESRIYNRVDPGGTRAGGSRRPLDRAENRARVIEQGAGPQ